MSRIHTPDSMVISFLTLRKALGWLGISLPLILIIGTYTIGQCHEIQPSISHYYYTVMGDVFGGTLCIIGVFLISYRGYDNKDNLFTSIAGIFALGVAMLPTSHDLYPDCMFRNLKDIPAGLYDLRINAHYICASIFLLTLAYISAFRFTKSSGQKTKEKKQRNMVYIVCALMIFIAIFIIFLLDYVFKSLGQKLEVYHFTFWFEWFALFGFGTSWLIKGEFLLKDQNHGGTA